MRSMRALAAAALFLFAAPLFADCTFPVDVKTQLDGTYRVTWSPTVGATSFEVQVSSDSFQHVTKLATLPGTATGMTVNALSSSYGTRYTFRIVAAHANVNIDVPCTADVTVYSPSLGFASRVRRSVLPIVGSTAGVNNARFKTSLRLGPATVRSAGKIIFHPAGRAGSDDDPSIPYLLERGDTLQFDDIVASIGQSGLGSLDIVPWNSVSSGLRSIPIEARLFNQAPEGTYGAFESAVQPGDVFQPPDWTIFVPSARFRVNIGLRTLTAAKVTFSHVRGAGGVTQKVVDYNADYVFLQAADQFFGEPVLPGDTIVISVSGTNVIAIPFHTFTDNSTNDPEVFKPESPARLGYADVELPAVTPIVAQ